MVFGQGIECRSAPELLLVEHDLQHATQLGFIQDRSEVATLCPGLAGSWMNETSSDVPPEIH